MSMRIHYSFRERAGLIGGLSVTTVAVVGLITASNWQPDLVDDFGSPYSSVVSEIDGILPSGLVFELVAETPALAAAGGFVSAETQGRSTEPPVNAEGLITGEPPSSLGADAPLVLPSGVGWGGGDIGQPGTPGGGGGGAPTTPSSTTTPTPSPTPTTTQPPPNPRPTTTQPPPDPDPTTTQPPPDPDPTTTDPPLPDPDPTTTDPPLPDPDPTTTDPPPPDPDPTTTDPPPPDPDPTTTDPPPPTGPTAIESELPPLP